MTVATVRLVQADDFDAIAAITNHYIRHTTIHFGAETVTAAELRGIWREHDDLYPWLVASHDGEILGYAKSGTFRARAAYRWTTESSVYLAPQHCYGGLGTRLYARLCATLRQQGFHAAIGGIALPNDVSVRLHERLGFVHCGTVRRAGRKFDCWHDVGFWHLALQPASQTPGPIATPEVGFAASG